MMQSLLRALGLGDKSADHVVGVRFAAHGLVHPAVIFFLAVAAGVWIF